ncbi:hypothetical protein QQP08_024900 [Theobroma cacao]|nr:hypothetical protein QQP08_024900 [Theobroma cacao]
MKFIKEDRRESRHLKAPPRTQLARVQYLSLEYNTLLLKLAQSSQRKDRQIHQPAMSRHRRQASRVLPPELTLEGDEPPPKSTDSTQAIASPYGRHGSNGSTTDRSAANPSAHRHQDSSGNHSQGPETKPSASTKPS